MSEWISKELKSFKKMRNIIQFWILIYSEFTLKIFPTISSKWLLISKCKQPEINPNEFFALNCCYSQRSALNKRGLKQNRNIPMIIRTLTTVKMTSRTPHFTHILSHFPTTFASFCPERRQLNLRLCLPFNFKSNCK